jgi:hypothetical protein
MTPTLLGRWQIRIFLLATVGLLISFLVGLGFGGNYQVPLLALLYVLLFGLVWDVLYQVMTSYRWDRDWPTSYQVAAGVIEGALVWVLILTHKLPGIAEPPHFIVFLIQYGAIWLSIFLLTQGPLRIFSVNWRYQGGQWFASRRRVAAKNSYQQHPAPVTGGAGWYNPQPSPLHQAAGGNSLQQPVSGLQIVAGNPFQPPAPPSQLVRPGYRDHHHSQEEIAGQQSAQPYVCACGLAFDRTTGNFCPRCGRIKVQQRVS